MTYARSFAVAAALALLCVPAVVVGQAATAQAPTRPPVVKHSLKGRANCMMCHAVGVMKAVPDVPADHKDRTNETCLWCHGPDAAMQTKTPKEIPHSLTGHSNCMMCHKPGVLANVPDVPADHAGRANTTCQMCHHPKKPS